MRGQVQWLLVLVWCGAAAAAAAVADVPHDHTRVYLPSLERARGSDIHPRRREAGVLGPPLVAALPMPFGTTRRIAAWVIHTSALGSIDILCAALAARWHDPSRPTHTVRARELCTAYVPEGAIVVTFARTGIAALVRTLTTPNGTALVDWYVALEPEDRYEVRGGHAAAAPFRGVERVHVTLTPPCSRERTTLLVELWSAVLRPHNVYVWADGDDYDGVVLSYPHVAATRRGDAWDSMLRTVVAAHPHVLHIAAEMPTLTLNQWAAPLLQQYTATAGGGLGTASLWSAGLDGTTATVGVSDTGLDRYHPMFYDTTHGITPSSAHRKLQAYQTLVYHSATHFARPTDFTDHISGHGTHVTGTAVGAAPGALGTPWRGVAYAARLVFVDLQDADMPQNALALPGDLDTGLLRPMRSAGARVLSGSWGSSGAMGYSTAARQCDSFMWGYRDTLVLFAAGNSGLGGSRTVTNPGLAKNALTVGMVLSSRASAQYVYTSQWMGVQFSGSAAARALHVGDFSAPAPGAPDGTVSSTAYNGLVLQLPSSSTACTVSALQAAGAAGRVVITQWVRAVCDDTTRIVAATRAGAKALIFYDPGATYASVPPPVADGSEDWPSRLEGAGTLPLVLAMARVGTTVSTVATGTAVTFARGDGTPPSATMAARMTYYNPDALSAYSSLGPTLDGRIKPDVVAIGEWVTSARAGDPTAAAVRPAGEAGLLSMRGTSMATPAVAGAAALVYQYFVEGWYPSGVRHGGGSGSVVPSGTLMKAMLVHSARPLGAAGARVHTDSGTLYGQDNPPAPSHQWGWGAVQLGSALYLAGRNAVGLFVDDTRAFTVGAGSTVMYGVTHPGGGATLRVTLAWADYPCTVSCNTRALINDLDVFARRADGIGAVYWGNGGATRDTANNVEQIDIPAAALGGSARVWHVTVRGTAVNLGTNQPYSLVITTNTRTGFGVSVGAVDEGVVKPEGGNSAPVDVPTSAARRGRGAPPAVFVCLVALLSIAAYGV